MPLMATQALLRATGIDMSAFARRDLTPADLRMPPSATPRPGDRVVWYVDTRRVSGKYLGHGVRGRPVVQNNLGNQTRLTAFDCLRLERPEVRRGPNWEYLPKRALMKRPMPAEKAALDKSLSRRIPPGPTYIELMEEIWGRGYEVYVVGGTVRDVLAGQDAHDVDLVTTIPIARLRPLLRTMFRDEIGGSDENGYARLGGKGVHGDPFIDLKLFCHGDTGTPDALFGADFALDVSHRDFACNAVYYDPVNSVLIDPTGRGISDAEEKRLHVVCDPTLRRPAAVGQVSLRYFKFILRGFQPTSATRKVIEQKFIPCLSALTDTDRLGYIKRQIFGKLAVSDHVDAKAKLEVAVNGCGVADLWRNCFESICSEICK